MICFVCGHGLDNAFDTELGESNQPMCGLEFTTPGHYGTCLFDPMDGSRLAINVCDDCLHDRWSRTMLYTADGKLAPAPALPA